MYLSSKYRSFGLNDSSKGFTLVELIVVITILAILGAIGFVSFSSYSTNARDSVRVTDGGSIYSQLNLTSAMEGALPFPDDKITILSDGSPIGYQGYAGTNVLRSIKIEKGGRDPSTNDYYTYSVDSTQRGAQLLVYLEDADPTNAFALSSSVIPEAYAEDLSKRKIGVIGKKLGILVQSGSLEPAQNAKTNIDILTTTTPYHAYISNATILRGGSTVLSALDSTYRKGGELAAPSSCSEGFIPVPGDESLGQPGFCVAKYEMRPQSTAGQVQNATYKTWNYAPSMQIASTQVGEPIATITQQQAIDACKSIGAHLITNNEWMTIARNIESVPSNWTSGGVGSGAIYSGHNDNAPSYALSSSVDSDGYYQTGDTTGSNQRRTHTLSNEKVIWDFAGNVWEHVNKANTLSGVGYATGQTSVAGCSGPITWSEFNTCTNTGYTSKNTGYRSAQGIGQIYYSQGVGDNEFIRGGDWSNGGGAGVFALFLNWVAAAAYPYVGFRCAQ